MKFPGYNLKKKSLFLLWTLGRGEHPATPLVLVLLFNHNTMSKVFEENAQKAINLSEGLKKHFSEVSRYGVIESELDRLKDDALAAIAKIKEVEAMRLEVSKKLIAANAALDAVKEHAMKYRKLIKSHYSQEQWLRFGIQDKR